MSAFQCPNCGRSLKVIPLSEPGGGWERGRSFGMGAPPPGAEYSREVPAADLSGVEAGVKTPLAQAVITGLAVGAVTVILAVWKGWPWVTPIVAAVIAAALSWWLLLLNTRGLLKTVETVINRDLDGDGRIGFTVEVTDLTDGKKQVRYCHFPARPDQVVAFAAAMLNGQTTIYGNHGLSRRVFSRLRDEAIARGLCTWVDPQAHTQGMELTRAGEHVFERLLLERGV